MGGDEKLPSEGEVLHLSLSLSPPTLPLPRVPSGSPVFRSGGRPLSSEVIPDSLRGGKHRLGLGSPSESGGGAEGGGGEEKEAATRERTPRRGGGGRREGSRGGAGASWEGAQSLGPGRPPPLPAQAEDPELLLLLEIC